MLDVLIPSAVNSGHERRFRSAPKAWQDVIKTIYSDGYQGKPISYDRIQEVATSQGLKIARESLRVKFARYKSSGYIRSGNKRGTFWVTNKGLEFFGLKLRTKPNHEPKTAVPQTPPSRWSQKALKITETASTVAE